jgi:hypothetical protein
MLRRQIQILDQAREALQERWQVVEAAEQAGIQLEVDRVVGASLVLAVLSGTADVLWALAEELHAPPTAKPVAKARASRLPRQVLHLPAFVQR